MVQLDANNGRMVTCAASCIPLVRRAGTMQAVKGLSMEKWFCWGAMGVAGLLLLLFVLDLVMNVPFGGVWKGVDIMLILASSLVIYLAYDAFRDIK
jgi:hypothetical protein